MKFTLSWLKDHLETEATLDEITEALTAIGLEVEAVENPAEKLEGFTVGYVRAAEPHPNADRLKLCTVETKFGEAKVVCGASNARTGMKGVYAPEGTYIPGSGFVLKAAKIRGVESRGMLCSERELELSDEHEGIIELPADAKVGAPVAQVLGLDDSIIEVAVTPNRQDALGVYGIARDLAAKGLGKLKEGSVAPVDGEFDSPIDIELEFDAETADACPVFAGRLVRGVKNMAAPDWMQRRLRAIGLRPISALVDITNYVTFDRGRPLHVYDATKLEGDIRARLGKKGESFLALDGKSYEVDGDMTVIADDAQVLGLGGIIGGEDTGVTEATTDVFIESAYFDPLRTAQTGRRLGINSDARYRFERGVDPAFVVDGLELATHYVRDICGGTPSTRVVAGAEPVVEKRLSLRPSRVERLTGVAFSAEDCAAILDRLGFGVIKADGELAADVPSWRPDIEGEADLVEEVIRIHGYDTLPAQPLPRADAVARATLSPMQQRTRKVRRAMAADGFHEAVTWSFIRRVDAENFGGVADELVLSNPISSDMDAMRPSLLPGLIAAAKRNWDRGSRPVALFEIGYRYFSDAPDGQNLTLALVLMGAAGARSWRGETRAVDAFDAKNAAWTALGVAGAPLDNLQSARKAPDWYHPGQSGALSLGPKNMLAHFGAIHPKILREMDIEEEVVGAEIFLDAVPFAKRGARTRPKLEMSDLQAVERDFAFVIDEDEPVEDLLRAVKGAEKRMISDVRVFDIYRGKGVPDGQKSVAISLLLTPREATFTEAELEAIAAKVIGAAERTVGARLRG